ncbi:MAG: hypothetical protein ACTSXO_09015 [Candidatus Heimdallarchaeota archaeon]|nr:hypothetical protein [Candidatus Heimdallarchaeota archaeon]
MPCILCNKEIGNAEETLEVYTTDNQKLTVHKECYEEYVKSMSMCGSCSGCSGCG